MSAAEKVDAKKNAIGAGEALAMAREASQIYATKGKNVIHFDMKKDSPSDEELRAVLIGPSGNLRAPTVRKGKTLIVGFDEATYRKVFG